MSTPISASTAAATAASSNLLPSFTSNEGSNASQDFQRMLRHNVAQMTPIAAEPMPVAQPASRAPEQAAPSAPQQAPARADQGISETQKEENRLNARTPPTPVAAKPEGNAPAPARTESNKTAAEAKPAEAPETPDKPAETAAPAAHAAAEKPKAAGKADKSKSAKTADAGKITPEAAAAADGEKDAAPADLLATAAEAAQTLPAATDPALAQHVAASHGKSAKADKHVAADKATDVTTPTASAPQAEAAKPVDPQAAATGTAGTTAAAPAKVKAAPASAGLAPVTAADSSAPRAAGASASPARLSAAADATPGNNAAAQPSAAAAAAALAAGTGKAAAPSETLVNSTPAGGNRPSLQAIGALGGAMPASQAGPTEQATAAAPDSAAAAPAELVLPQPLTDPAFSTEMAARLSVLASKGVQEAHLHLNPAEMGPVAVQITVDGQQAQISFHAAHAETRAVLENSLPELAAALRDTGLTLSGGGVFQQNAGQGGAPHDGSASSARSSGANGRNQRMGSEDLHIAGPAATPMRATRGVLDLYA